MSWPWRMGMSRGLALLELAESLWASRAATPLSSLPLPACRAISVGPSTSLKKMNKLPGTSFLICIYFFRAVLDLYCYMGFL